MLNTTPTITRLLRIFGETFPKAIGIGPNKIIPANCVLEEVEGTEGDWSIPKNNSAKPMNINIRPAVISFIY